MKWATATRPKKRRKAYKRAHCQCANAEQLLFFIAQQDWKKHGCVWRNKRFLQTFFYQHIHNPYFASCEYSISKGPINQALKAVYRANSCCYRMFDGSRQVRHWRLSWVDFNLTVWPDETSILRNSRTFPFKQVEPVFGRGLEPIKNGLRSCFSVCLFATNRIVGRW